MGVIIFNNQSSADFGLEVATFPSYEIPERDYDIIHVPGRNGDVIIDNGTFKNVSRSYTVSVATGNNSFPETVNPIVEWLHSSSGYARLEDSYEPDYYRMALYKDSNTIYNLYNDAAQANISFECKPQRFLKSGTDTVQSFMASGSTITNPTAFTSYPIITLSIATRSTGSLTIGSQTFSIKAQSSGTLFDITIDSELQDVYSGTLNKNSMITLSNGEFPKLKPGSSTITFSGCIAKVEVIPKWWTI